ncbi:MAG: Mur ligase family protein [Bacteroidales bacterium]|nr:Mur ligase family protein [Bacteroidales bacterium]
MEKFSEEAYRAMVEALFMRFPSFQKAGASAYKPGIGNMVFFDQMLGHPHRKYPSVHVAGTNGKGSVSNMLASVLAGSGLKVGLYTSPHILDFRERIRIADGRQAAAGQWHLAAAGEMPSAGITLKYIGKEEVWDFVQKWGETFDHLDLSFFEITTSMAFAWFASEEVDVAVIETGLGGRLDSTNIISPALTVITNIGLDHCDMLGGTLPEIAFEKAGIIKPSVPAVIGESCTETDQVFERKVLYANLPETEFMGGRNRIMSLLTFADRVEPHLWEKADEMLGRMDLQGIYQRENLRTVLASLDVLCKSSTLRGCRGWNGFNDGSTVYSIVHTAETMDFHGRWEKLRDIPYTIADIGHNSHGLKYNFEQLGQMMSGGQFDRLTIVYGAMADKDVDVIMQMLPKGAEYIFVTAPGKRAMQAEDIYGAFVNAGGDPSAALVCGSVQEAMAAIYGPCAVDAAPDNGSSVCMEAAGKGHGSCSDSARRLVYIGGSTYVVSEASALLRTLQ